MDKILLIDGHNFAWRANITFNSSPEIDDTYVLIFNFFRNLRVLIEQFDPTKAFYVLEGHPQFRYDLYPEYKANRIIKEASAKASSSKERFNRSHPDIVRLLHHLPITLAKAEHYEADDVIATLAENLKEEDVIIVSGDTDYIQLLQKGYKKLRIYNAIKKAFVQAPEYPYAFWKSLSGDKSDNIKGLTGDKTAQKLLKDPLKLKAFMEIEENRALFNINRQLIEFRSVPLEEIILEEGNEDFNLLAQEFTKMELKTLVKDPYWSSFKETFSCIKV